MKYLSWLWVLLGGAGIIYAQAKSSQEPCEEVWIMECTKKPLRGGSQSFQEQVDCQIKQKRLCGEALAQYRAYMTPPPADPSFQFWREGDEVWARIWKCRKPTIEEMQRGRRVQCSWDTIQVSRGTLTELPGNQEVKTVPEGRVLRCRAIQKGGENPEAMITRCWWVPSPEKRKEPKEDQQR